MKCKFCSKETRNEYEVCEECEKTLTVAINKNRRKMVKTKIANQNRGITSLVCAIIAMTQPFGFVPSFICGIVAIVFANYSKNTAGATLGKVGKTLGIVSLVANVIFAIMSLVKIIVNTAMVILVILCVIAIKRYNIL